MRRYASPRIFSSWARVGQQNTFGFWQLHTLHDEELRLEDRMRSCRKPQKTSLERKRYIHIDIQYRFVNSQRNFTVNGIILTSSIRRHQTRSVR